jgi:glycosyltransferase involved in cell wall biosynthesis
LTNSELTTVPPKFGNMPRKLYSIQPYMPDSQFDMGVQPTVNNHTCKVAVLIPCYNESATIGKVVRDFNYALPSAQIYVYDNNSQDETVRKAIEAGAIVRQETIQGKGNVVRRMFREIEADLYVLVDGDDTYDAEKMAELVNLASSGNYDLVNCIRIDDNNEKAYRAGHRFGNWLLTTMVKFLFGDRIEDMLSGYKVFSRRFVKSFPLISQGFEIETELTVHALELKMPIAHVEGTYRDRPTGSVSKLNTFRDGYRIISYILKLFRLERPLLFFSLISSVLVVMGLGLNALVSNLFITEGFILLAAVIFANGLVLETITHGRRETKMMNYLHTSTITKNREPLDLPILSTQPKLSLLPDHR